MNDYQRLKSDIVAAQIELTNICPLGCAECAYHYQSRPKGHMDPAMAKDVITQCVNSFGPISFNLNGLGEPLSYPYLPDIIRFIGEKSPKSRIELFTSLICKNQELTEKVISALSEVPNNVLLATAFHLYDFEGKGFEKQLKYYRFADFYDVLGDNHRIDFHIAMNITKYHTEDDKACFLETFSCALPQDKIHIVEKLDPWLELVRHNAVDTSEVMTPGVCDYLYKVIHIGWNGDVLICCTDDYAGESKIGSVLENNIDSLWNSDIINKIRERHNNLDVEGLAPCNRCGRTFGYVKR